MSRAASPNTDSISATGRVTRVGAKFAYLTSNNYGGVFVPPQAGLPPNCSNPDLNIYLKIGDIVHFTAHAQPPAKAKNSCAWIADRVTVSSQNTIYDAPPDDSEHVISDKVGFVRTVTETFAYIRSDQYGNVFFPGSAYALKPNEPARLNAIFTQDDMVMFCARSQPEMNGSRWLALSVAKVDEREIQRENTNPSPVKEEVPTPNVDVTKAVEGTGEVMLITACVALVRSNRLGAVFCPILRWAGPDAGEGAETLEDILKKGDLLDFVAIPQRPKMGCNWRAIKFHPPGLDDTNVVQQGTSEIAGQQVINESLPKMVSDSAAQTYTPNEQYVVQAIKTDPDMLAVIKDRKPTLGQYVFDE